MHHDRADIGVTAECQYSSQIQENNAKIIEARDKVKALESEYGKSEEINKIKADCEKLLQPKRRELEASMKKTTQRSYEILEKFQVGRAT